MCDVADHMAADPARARKYIADYTGLAVALVQDTPLNKWTCKINLPVWQKVADMMHEGGELQKPFKIDDMLSDFAKVNVTK
jgi:ABC-type nitrate/sulfonate/bicarbonate transport system substrate-binding protein